MRQNDIYGIFLVILLTLCMVFTYTAFTAPYALAAASASASASLNKDTSRVDTNEEIIFTTQFADQNDFPNIKHFKFLINSKISFEKCFCGYYNRKSGKLYVRSGYNKRWKGGCVPGSGKVIGNAYASLDCSKTQVLEGENGLIIKWAVTFSDKFKGRKNLYVYAKDKSGRVSGWQNVGFVNISNLPPVLARIGNKKVAEGEPLEFRVKAFDPDGDELFYSVEGLPGDDATFRNGVFWWVPDYNDSGKYKATFSVTDGEFTDTETVNIKVKSSAVKTVPLKALYGRALLFCKGSDLLQMAALNGLNIVTLNPTSGEMEDFRNFDNRYDSLGANEAMAGYMGSIPEGRIIIAGITGEAHHLNEAAYQSFEALGSEYIRDIEKGDKWLIIAKKGGQAAFAETYLASGAEELEGPCAVEADIELELLRENIPPDGIFLINGGTGAAQSSNVELDLSGIVDLPSEGGVARMCFSNDGKNWSAPEYFQTKKRWYLERGDGSKTVYAKFADMSGNWNREPITSEAELVERYQIHQVFPYAPSYTNDICRDGQGNVYAVWGMSKPDGTVQKVVFASGGGDEAVGSDTLKIISGSTSLYGGYGYIRRHNSSGPVLSCNEEGGVYAAWESSEGDICVNFSHDYGRTWLAEPVKLTDNYLTGEGRAYHPMISSDNEGNIYIAWVGLDSSGHGVYFNASNDGGAAWLPDNIKVNKEVNPDRYSTRLGSYQNIKSAFFDMASDDKGGVYIAWMGRTEITGARPEIFFNASLDGGRTWGENDLRISDGKSFLSVCDAVQIGCDRRDNVFIAWTGSRGGDKVIYFMRSENRGIRWQDMRTIEYPAAAFDKMRSFELSMKNTDAGSVYLVAWAKQGRNDTYPCTSDVLFACSRNHGLSWSVSGDIVTSPGYITKAYAPELACDSGGGVYVIWNDDRNDILNNYRRKYDARDYKGDVYLNYSLDFGRTWLAEDIRLNKEYSGREKDGPSAGNIGIAASNIGIAASYENPGAFSVLWNNEGRLYQDNRAVSYKK